MYALVNQSLVQVDPEEGVDPETFFSEVLFAGGYAQAWEALRSGVVDVSIIAGDVCRRRSDREEAREMVGRLKSELRGRAGQAVRGSKGRRGASRRRKAGGARSMARRLTGRG